MWGKERPLFTLGSTNRCSHCRKQHRDYSKSQRLSYHTTQLLQFWKNTQKHMLSNDAALFITVRNQNSPKCQSTDNECGAYTQLKFCSVAKKRKLKFTGKWLKLKQLYWLGNGRIAAHSLLHVHLNFQSLTLCVQRLPVGFRRLERGYQEEEFLRNGGNRTQTL